MSKAYDAAVMVHSGKTIFFLQLFICIFYLVTLAIDVVSNDIIMNEDPLK